MTGKWLGRRELRALHLLAAVPLTLYFYGPWAGTPTLEAVLRGGVLPALSLSGVAMWLLPRLRRFLTRRRRDAAVTG